MRAGRRMAPMIGLVDVDVTKANRLLAASEPPLSLTAFVVASVARAAAAHPEVHAYRNWRGQLVTHQHVDVTTMIEIPTAQGPFGLPHVLHDADVRDVPDLTAELRRVKRQPSASGSGRWLERAAPAATHIPGAVEAMYEQIAKDFSALDDAPPRCVPGQSAACAGANACQGYQVCEPDGTFAPCRCGA